MAITHPTDPRIRGLAAAILVSDTLCWEFDIRAAEPGTDPQQVSDWERRRRRKEGDASVGVAAIAPLPLKGNEDHG